MARTTSGEVELIIEVEDSISLTPFIDAANALVTEVCLPVARYDLARLTLIETWLAAHFYANRDHRRSQEQAGPTMESFQFKVGLNLSNTMYGQQAQILDTEGALSALDEQAADGVKRQAPAIMWLGTDPDA